MNTKILFAILALLFFAVGCNKSEVDFHKGNGFIKYDNNTYSLNFTTMVTNEYKDQDGIYEHGIVFSNTENGNVAFSFYNRDTNAKNEFNEGSYKVETQSNCTAHFDIGEASDVLNGTMVITTNGVNHTFVFTGHTVDENAEIQEVKLEYTGKIND